MSMGPHASDEYICPCCKGSLDLRADSLDCVSCKVSYPVDDEIADFSRGAYYDHFDAGNSQLSAEHERGLDDELIGTRARILDFYLPRLRSLREAGSAGDPLRVLDCGCGNGLSVDLLRDAGFAAWGNDISMLRKWQWQRRVHRNRLFVADGATLPFPDGYFDVVISSGVLEHVGVRESAGPPYAVQALLERDSLRGRFLGELLRVTGSGGRVWLDFPNGAFPIDFWHGFGAGGVRWHSLREGFLPTVREIRDQVGSLGNGQWAVRPLSPHGRLHFRRARRHWFGRALHAPADWFFRAMRLPLLKELAGSPLNPHLVIEIRSPRDRPSAAPGRQVRSRRTCKYPLVLHDPPSSGVAALEVISEYLL